MKTCTFLPNVVQAVRDLAPKLAAVRDCAESLGGFLKNLDALLLLSTVQQARQALEQVITEARTERPGESAKLVPYRVRTALGALSFQLCSRHEDGQTQRGLDAMQLWHGCTLSVREQCAFLLAHGTAQEARDAMLLFRSSVPGESTIQRVVATDGARMMQVCDTHVAGRVAPPRTGDVAGALGVHLRRRREGSPAGNHSSRKCRTRRPRRHPRSGRVQNERDS